MQITFTFHPFKNPRTEHTQILRENYKIIIIFVNALKQVQIKYVNLYFWTFVSFGYSSFKQLLTHLCFKS